MWNAIYSFIVKHNLKHKVLHLHITCPLSCIKQIDRMRKDSDCETTRNYICHIENRNPGARNIKWNGNMLTKPHFLYSAMHCLFGFGLFPLLNYCILTSILLMSLKKLKDHLFCDLSWEIIIWIFFVTFANGCSTGTH